MTGYDTMLLLIDNYDSFTWNLYQYFCQCGIKVRVVRNDQISIQQMEQLPLTHLVISPGPCTPSESGISMQAIVHFAGKLPILGVCLGHQAIGQVFGAKVIKAPQVMHGKTSLIYHDRQGVFQGIVNPVNMTRYHSLIVDADSLPEELIISAWTCDLNGKPELIMGLRHQSLAIESVQFHPESILSEQGLTLLKNFVSYAS